jgi:hypothetical protein
MGGMTLDNLLPHCSTIQGNRYVSATTSSYDDMNTCLNENKPCRSLNAAISRGVEAEEAVVTVRVLGEYDDGTSVVTTGVFLHLHGESASSQSMWMEEGKGEGEGEKVEERVKEKKGRSNNNSKGGNKDNTPIYALFLFIFFFTLPLFLLPSLLQAASVSRAAFRRGMRL